MRWLIAVLVSLLFVLPAFGQADLNYRYIPATIGGSVDGLSPPTDLAAPNKITLSMVEGRLFLPQIGVCYQHLFKASQSGNGILNNVWLFEGNEFGGNNSKDVITLNVTQCIDRIELFSPSMLVNRFGVQPFALVDFMSLQIDITGKPNSGDTLTLSRTFAKNSFGLGIAEAMRYGQVGCDARVSYTFLGDSRVAQLLIEARYYPARSWIPTSPFFGIGYFAREFKGRGDPEIIQRANGPYLTIGFVF